MYCKKGIPFNVKANLNTLPNSTKKTVNHAKLIMIFGTLAITLPFLKCLKAYF
jgi:hypothetical protein